RPLAHQDSPEAAGSSDARGDQASHHHAAPSPPFAAAVFAAALLPARRSLDRAARAHRLARLAPRILSAPRRRRRRTTPAVIVRSLHLEWAGGARWSSRPRHTIPERYLRAQTRGRRSHPVAERA